MLRLAPLLVVAGLAVPILVGLVAVLLPALGWWPALGGTHPGLAVLAELRDSPGLAASVRLTIGVGLASTALSVAAMALVRAAMAGSPRLGRLRLAWAPLVAVPHVATAVGFAFLVAPSGLLLRLVSPWLTGFTDPPDWSSVQDPWGVCLTAGLVLKETPFLLLVAGGALDTHDDARRLAVARSLGYAPFAAWMASIFPLLYRQIRRPVWAVLVYATGAVDVALILGPTTPPTLPVAVLRWATSPDLALRFRAAAGSLLLLAVVGLCLGFWIGAEALVARAGAAWLARGRRHWLEAPARGAGALLAALLAGVAVLVLASVALWSVATAWPFPRALPQGLGLATWIRQAPGAFDAVGTGLGIALAATGAALVLAVAALESATRARRSDPLVESMMFAPLLVPELSVLTGLQILILGSGLDGRPLTVAAVHLLVVLPYVYLSLSGPWRALDVRFGDVAATLGARPLRTLFAVRLPLLARPLALAAAIGFSVSLAQYLSTVMIGGGQVITVTTEAVARAAGGDRRIVAVYALLQMLLPGLAFLLAALLPRRGTRAPGAA